MKSILKVLGMICLACSLTSPVQAAPREIIYTWYGLLSNPMHVHGHAVWLRALEKATGNKIKIAEYASGTICPDAESMEACSSGIVDMAHQLIGRNPGKFPRLEITSLPMMFNSSPACTFAFCELIDKYPSLQNELKDYKLFSWMGGVPTQLLLRDKPVRKFEDLKGLKLGINQANIASSISALGAVPVFVSYSDMYLAMERGMVDGLILPETAMIALKVDELTKYMTIINLIVSGDIAVMNKGVWDSLGEEIQNELNPLLGPIGGLRRCLYHFPLQEQGWESLKRHGAEIITLPPEEYAKLEEAVKPVHEAWLAEMEAKGFDDIRAIHADLMALAKKYSDIDAVKAKMMESLKAVGLDEPTWK